MLIHKKITKVLVLMAIIAGGWTVCPAPAFADLMIAPLRIVFQDRSRSAEVTVINTSKRTNTYRIGWKMSVMDENGQYRDVEFDDKTPYSLPAMVAFSPRQVKIEPGDRQRVRLSLRRPADLPPGEYRAHLVFTRLPPEGGRKNNELAEGAKGVHLQMNVLLNYSIPVIVRNGADPKDTKIELSDPVFTGIRDKIGREKMGLTIARTAGSYSSFGRIRVYARMPGEEEEREVGVLNNVALWPENTRRRIEVPLAAVVPAGHKVRVVYEGQKEYTNMIWDEEVYSVTR